MAIFVHKAPSIGEEIVRVHLTARKDCLKHIRLADGVVPIGSAHHVYTTTKEDLLKRQFLQGARPTAWLYAVGPHNEPQGLAELSCGNRRGSVPLEYTSLHAADVAKELLQAIRAVEALPEVAQAHYELRILRAPSLSLVAIWLHGIRDLIVPVRATREVMERLGQRRTMSEEELEQALLPLAKHRMQTLDRG